MTLNPRAWVGCLGCYNAGALVGTWVDANEAEDFEPHSILHGDTQETEPPCERTTSDERWCLDFEDFGGLLSGECSPSEAAEMAEIVGHIEAEGYPVEAVAAWRDNVGKGYANLDDLDDFADAFAGEWPSGEDYAKELADEIGAIDSEARWPNDCIDWNRAWRELMFDGYWEHPAPGGNVYIFHN